MYDNKCTAFASFYTQSLPSLVILPGVVGEGIIRRLVVYIHKAQVAQSEMFIQCKFEMVVPYELDAFTSFAVVEVGHKLSGIQTLASPGHSGNRFWIKKRAFAAQS